MSKQEELEVRIREQRTVEANNKGLVGQAGKIGTVLRVFGSPIIGQSEGGAYVDTHYIDTRPKIDDEMPRDANEFMRSIPVAGLPGTERPEGEEWSEMDDATPYGTYTVGRHFDGLGRGMHMEIFYKEESSSLSVYHRGLLVYKEVMGEISCYVPGEEWESWIDRLSKSAKDILRKSKEEEFAKKVEEAEKIKKSWWRTMKSRWGVT